MVLHPVLAVRGTAGGRADRRRRRRLLRQRRSLPGVVPGGLMPTYLRLPRFNCDWERLSKQDQERFRAALVVFVADLAAGGAFRPGLRVKKMAGHDIWEMTWAPDGRATFSY